jgi:hypothetical protein
MCNILFEAPACAADKSDAQRESSPDDAWHM